MKTRTEKITRALCVMLAGLMILAVLRMTADAFAAYDYDQHLPFAERLVKNYALLLGFLLAFLVAGGMVAVGFGFSWIWGLVEARKSAAEVRKERERFLDEYERLLPLAEAWELRGKPNDLPESERGTYEKALEERNRKDGEAGKFQKKRWGAYSKWAENSMRTFDEMDAKAGHAMSDDAIFTTRGIGEIKFTVRRLELAKQASESSRERILDALEGMEAYALLELLRLSAWGAGLLDVEAMGEERLEKAKAWFEKEGRHNHAKRIDLYLKVSAKKREEKKRKVQEEATRLVAEEKERRAKESEEAERNRYENRVARAGGKVGVAALVECAGIYVIHRPDDGLVKVGKTGDFKSRFSQIRRDCFSAGHGEIEPVVLFPVNEYRETTEKSSHSRLCQHRRGGEWFKCDAKTAVLAVLDSLPTTA